MTALDQASLDAIWSREIDQPFNAHPTWPGGASGITIGGGFYDLGQQSSLRIGIDWQALPEMTVTRLMSYAGLHGAAAQRQLANCHDIQTPEAISREVFGNIVVPRYVTQTIAAFPGAAALPPGCLGALVSLVFNRGTAMDDPPGEPDARLEMRQIRDAVAADTLDLIPGLIRSMTRLWPTVAGLRARREAEAEQFAAALHPSLTGT